MNSRPARRAGLPPFRPIYADSPAGFPFVAGPDDRLARRRARHRARIRRRRRARGRRAARRHVFNVCRDRYRFAVSLCAALVAGKISLLPSTHTPEMVRQLASFAPDAFCLHDAPDCAIDLPRFAYPDAAPASARAMRRSSCRRSMRRESWPTCSRPARPARRCRTARPGRLRARGGRPPQAARRPRGHADRHGARAAHVRLRVDGAARADRRPRVQQSPAVLPGRHSRRTRCDPAAARARHVADPPACAAGGRPSAAACRARAVGHRAVVGKARV